MVRSRVDSPMVEVGVTTKAISWQSAPHLPTFKVPRRPPIDNMSSDERVTINVGGTRFEVPRRTLGRFPDSLLGPLAAPDSPTELQREPNGEYFFDRYAISAYFVAGKWIGS